MFKNLLSNYGHSLILTLFVMLLGLFVFVCVCKEFGGVGGVSAQQLMLAMIYPVLWDSNERFTAAIRCPWLS